jgi:hypothetical protein
MPSLPVPPAHTAVSSAGQVADTTGVVVALVIIAVAAVRLHRRTGSWVPILIPITALGSGFLEPMYNLGSDLWYFQPGQVSMYQSFGFRLPIWVFLSYSAFYGGLGLLLWWLLERGASRAQVWKFLGALWVVAALVEIANINLHTYTYYGPQPFRLDHFPLWIPLSNAAICTVLGVAAAHLGRLLHGAKQLLILVVGPVAIAAGLFGTAFPEATVLHTVNPARWLVYLAAIASMALAFGVAWLAIECVPADGLKPADRLPDGVEAAVAADIAAVVGAGQ